MIDVLSRKPDNKSNDLCIKTVNCCRKNKLFIMICVIEKGCKNTYLLSVYEKINRKVELHTTKKIKQPFKMKSKLFTAYICLLLIVIEIIYIYFLPGR